MHQRLLRILYCCNNMYHLYIRIDEQSVRLEKVRAKYPKFICLKTGSPAAVREVSH